MSFLARRSLERVSRGFAISENFARSRAVGGGGMIRASSLSFHTTSANHDGTEKALTDPPKQPSKWKGKGRDKLWGGDFRYIFEGNKAWREKQDPNWFKQLNKSQSPDILLIVS